LKAGTSEAVIFGGEIFVLMEIFLTKDKPKNGFNNLE
jgi:hypothetical protein